MRISSAVEMLLVTLFHTHIQPDSVAEPGCPRSSNTHTSYVTLSTKVPLCCQLRETWESRTRNRCSGSAVGLQRATSERPAGPVFVLWLAG